MLNTSSLLENPLWRRVIKFAITGGFALIIDIAIYFMLTRYGHVSYIVSRSISLGIAIIWNFTVNRYWTFQAIDGKMRDQVPRFLAVIIATSLLSLFLMRIGVSNLHINDLAVLLIVVPITTLINFFAHYFWSYAKRCA